LHVAALVTAASILLVCTGLPIALGIYFVVIGFGQPGYFAIGLVLLVIGWFLRPRLAEVPAEAITVNRTEAPATFALLDRVASAIGGRPVDLVIIDAEFNASYRRAGWRQREVLTVGVPLWIALRDQERVALLGHELAHQVNGDISFGLVIGSALQTLARWAYVLGHGGFRRPYRSRTDLLESLVRAVMQLISEVVLAVLRLERSMQYGLQQRAEYFADRLAAHVGSKEAALELIDKLHLARPCIRRLQTMVQRDERDPSTVVSGFFAELSPKEWERLRRVDARVGQAIDSTHPATSLRHALLQRQDVSGAAVTTSAAEQASIQAELAPAFERAGAALLEEIRSRAQ
jgi:Zn-dependent protease with chaperone function